MKELYAVVGTIASGKTEVGEVLRNEGFTHLEATDYLLEELLRRGVINPLRKDFNALYDEKFKTEGPDFIAKALIRKLNGMEAEKVVMTGLRNALNLHILKSRYDVLRVIGVNAPVELRAGYFQTRQRDIDQDISQRSTLEVIDYLNSQIRENSEVARALATCHYHIANTGTIEELHQKVLSIVHSKA